MKRRNKRPAPRPTPFAVVLLEHMQTLFRINDRTWPSQDWVSGIYSDYRDLARGVKRTAPEKLDAKIDRLLSSQAFAFNLFLPFQEQPGLLSGRISKMVDAHITIDEIEFEWPPPPEILQEPGGRFATKVDVVLRGRLEGDAPAVVLVEVKCTEGEFSHCNGYDSPDNESPKVCASAELFLSDPSACYLIRSAKAPPDRLRRYWDIFGSVEDAFPGVDRTWGCPFAYDMQQPMRNLAIARGLEQEDMVDKAWFALCGHDDNRYIARHWQEWRRILPDPSMAPSIPASEIVSVGETEGLSGWAKYMRERYRL